MKRSMNRPMSRGRVNIIVIAALLISLAVPVQATTYYVSLSGNDGWSGTSPDSAWRHVTHAAFVIAAGDSVLIDSGTYSGENIVFANTGTPGNPITMTAYSSDRPIIHSNSEITIGTWTGSEARDYIDISELRITGKGIFARGGEHLNITDCEIYLTEGSGIHFIDVKNSTIDACDIHDIGWNCVMLQSCWRTDCGNISVTNCLLHDNPGSSGGPGHNFVDLFNYHEVLSDIDIIGNVIYDGAQKGLLCHYEDDPTMYNLKINNNIIVNTWDGIFVDDVRNSEINGNTIFNTCETGITVWYPDSCESVTINNNIVISGYIGIDAQNPEFEIAYNNTWNNPAGDIRGPIGPGNIHVYPVFADTVSYDFHLASQYGRWNGSGWVTDGVTSPCIDAGDADAEWCNEPEPNGGRLNMGAYGNTAEASKSPTLAIEGRTGPPTEVPGICVLHQNTPNPFSENTRINYELTAVSTVSIAVYDLLGRKVRTIIEGQIDAGSHSALWDGKCKYGIDVPEGVYLLVLQSDGYTLMRKLIIFEGQ